MHTTTCKRLQKAASIAVLAHVTLIATAQLPDNIIDLGTLAQSGEAVTIGTFPFYEGHPDSSFDTELALYDANGSLLAQNDDLAKLAISLTSRRSLINTQPAFATPGTFYIAVGGYNMSFLPNFEIARTGAQFGRLGLSVNNMTYTLTTKADQVYFFRFTLGDIVIDDIITPALSRGSSARLVGTTGEHTVTTAPDFEDGTAFLANPFSFQADNTFDNYDTLNSAGNTFTGNDVIHQFELAKPSTLTVSTPNENTQFALLSTMARSAANIATDTITLQLGIAKDEQFILGDFQPGTYYFVVESNSAQDDAYNFTLTSLPPCVGADLALPIGTLNTDDFAHYFDNPFNYDSQFEQDMFDTLKFLNDYEDGRLTMQDIVAFTDNPTNYDNQFDVDIFDTLRFLNELSSPCK